MKRVGILALVVGMVFSGSSLAVIEGDDSPNRCSSVHTQGDKIHTWFIEPVANDESYITAVFWPDPYGNDYSKAELHFKGEDSRSAVSLEVVLNFDGKGHYLGGTTVKIENDLIGDIKRKHARLLLKSSTDETRARIPLELFDCKR